MEEISHQLKEMNSGDIIIIDRSISDRMVWNMIRLLKNEMSKEQYTNVKRQYMNDASELIDYLVILYANALTALKRDYNAHLSLENRSFLNEENINDYNGALSKSEELLFDTVEHVSFIDTTYLGVQDTATRVARDMMPLIRERYLESFKKKYK